MLFFLSASSVKLSAMSVKSPSDRSIIAVLDLCYNSLMDNFEKEFIKEVISGGAKGAFLAISFVIMIIVFGTLIS